MTATVTSTSATPDPTYGSAAPATTNQNPSTSTNGGGADNQATAPTLPGQPVPPNPADLRLVIEDDPKAGCFIYKTVDWVTGKVISQLPREQLIKLREAENYSAGDVIDTSA